MGHIGARLAAQIVLQQGPQLHAPGIQHAYGGADRGMLCMAQKQLQHVVHASLFDQQALLHEHLAKVQIGVAQQCKDGAFVGKAYACLRLAIVAKEQCLSGWKGDFKPSRFDQGFKCMSQQFFGQPVQHVSSLKRGVERYGCSALTRDAGRYPLHQPLIQAMLPSLPGSQRFGINLRVLTVACAHQALPPRGIVP